VIVFAGPTIGRAEIQAIAPTFVVRGPARRGDVYRAALARPSVIALVDGTFDQTPAVWHKEILWALTLGIDVVGCSSMGALRAAELHPFGMRGVGAIFDAYATGRLTADDEVAVLHATAEHDFRPLSDALVNLRATFDSAERAGVLTSAVGGELQSLAQGLFYPERGYARVLHQARERGVAPAQLDAFERWLPSGKVDQKKADARALLNELATLDPRAVRPAPTFSFQQTEAWHRLRAALAESEPVATDAPAERSPALWHRAVLRAIAVRDARLQQARLAPGAVDVVVEQFRRERGLVSEEAFVAWLSQHFADDAEAARFFIEEALVRALIARHEPAAAAHLPHERLAAQDDDGADRPSR
jgi:hypothetical protein